MKFYNFESFLFMTVTFLSTVFGYYKIIDDELAGSFGDTLLYNDFCLQDNKDICHIYSKVLMKVIEQVNVDEESIGKLTNLWWLFLEENQLSGPIPESIGKTDLWEFFFSDNCIDCSEKNGKEPHW
ncbi:hypothetical protein PIROE2DRAFT_64811 [Piromyces sp. E2]|nr:hypothetical protein PIROE2DRAFT_64811 [Piromyces sp. E2]|eukprot:OUM57778.1 hypothetical protein PIROE2DRAFT_64811 [Piromyces sp. E2]